ncbi:calcium-binding protein [Sphingorhabdus arenilitoris]|uniref:Calcium-binding protein n=1 Tax=Sphingorhabdus arenilitoris TaxID=1490041 RepID=A0ABV8RDH1_9SPHN
MLRISKLAGAAALSAIAFSGVAMAQETPPAEETMPAEAPTETPAPDGEVTPTDVPPSDPSAPPAEAAPTEPSGPTPPVSREEQVAQVVEAEFPTYDADQSGALEREEFATWVTTLRQKSLEAQGRPPVPENEMSEWVKNAFAKADSDKSDNVSKSELQTFLMG